MHSLDNCELPEHQLHLHDYISSQISNKARFFARMKTSHSLGTTVASQKFYGGQNV